MEGIEEVKVVLNGEEHTLKYSSSGYYEIELTAPDEGGIYKIEAEATNILDEIVTDSIDLQVLIKEDVKVETDLCFAYFLDRYTFELKDVVQIQNYTTNIDEETNAKSEISVIKKLNVSSGDFVFLIENGEEIYQGIIESPINENGEVKHLVNAKYITNLFDRSIILRNEALIKSTGVEDFIKKTIENEFTKSSDAVLNLDYIDVEVLTHTKIQASVDTENGIYNFHTYMTNCTQNYNIIYTFAIVNKRLKITIAKQEDETQLLDCTLSDITNYTEVYETSVTAKVTVLSEDGGEYNLYLLADRTTTTNKNDENRAIGDVVAVYVADSEEAQQTALDKMKSNSYEHMLQFDINTLSKMFDVKSWKIGTPLKVKTKNNIILDTYVSAITKVKGSKFWTIKTGNIRIALLDKLKKER